MTKLHAQQPVHDDHFLLPCVIHLSTSECSWMLFHLFYTLSEDCKAGCYLHLLSCQNYQKQHGHSAGSRVKWQGMHVCLFYFQQRTHLMMSVRRPQRWSHFIRHAPFEDVRDEKKSERELLERICYLTKIRSPPVFSEVWIHREKLRLKCNRL